MELEITATVEWRREYLRDKKKKELQVNKQINQLLEAGTIILSLSGGQRSSPQTEI